jgi:CRISPR-associated protein Csb1
VKRRLRLRDDYPLVFADLARRVGELDPLCLLHGVFFADKKWPGQPKIARSVTAFVEAAGVERAESGGVKHDHVRHSLSDETGARKVGGTTEGYGTVPFHRTEWTAREITAAFVIDRDQIRSYGLGEKGSALLEAVAQWEICALLGAGLRLRTACDLHVRGEEVTDQSGASLPSLEELTKTVEALVDEDETRDLFSGKAPLVGTWRSPKKGVQRTAAEEEEEEDEGES